MGHFLFALSEGMAEDWAIFHSLHTLLQKHTFSVTNLTSSYFAYTLVASGLLITGCQRGTVTGVAGFSSEITGARSLWKHILKPGKNRKKKKSVGLHFTFP